MILHFSDQQFSVLPKDGQSLHQIIAECRGVTFHAPCGGHGVCRKCTVVTTGSGCGENSNDVAQLSPGDRLELLKKAKVPENLWNSAVTRYACLCRNLDGIDEVYLPGIASLTGAGVSDGLADPQSKDFRPLVQVRKISLPLTGELRENASPAVLEAAETLKNAGKTEAFAVTADEFLPSADFAGQQRRTRLTALTEDEPDPLGLAVDVGTTTVALSVWRMKDGRMFGECVTENPQRRFGADVIARMSYAADKEGGADELRRLILRAVCDGADQILDGYNKKTGENRTKDDIFRAVIAGNSVMEHLFLGLPTDTIAKAPFILRTQLGHNLPADEVFLPEELRFANPEAAVYFAPLAASYVGGDITLGLAYLLTSKEELAEDGSTNALFLDLGTNGELCVIAGEANRQNPENPRYLFAATAAGPALEGAQIKMGMSALPGAVSHVRLNGESGEFDCRVIGNGAVEPAGICGSGIISATAAALDAGLITSYGRICDDGEAEDEEYEEIYEKFEHTLGEDDDGRVTITLCGNVHLTDSDVRQVQTAKAAIAAGTKVLTDVSGMSEADLDRVYLAGSFGGGIDVNCAERIGLLPKDSGSRGKVLSVGNTSAKGAVMELFREDFRQKLAHIMQTSRYIELSCDPAFTDAFVSGMIFGDEEEE